MRNNFSWDEYFLGIAIMAAARSKDNSTQHGAVIVNSANIIIGTGYNGFIAGIEETEDLWKRPKKYQYVIHSEMNAIFNANQPVKGCKMYLYSSGGYYPCPECAKHIAQAGIVEIIVMGTPEVHPVYDWSITEDIFKKANIKLRLFVSDQIKTVEKAIFPSIVDQKPIKESKKINEKDNTIKNKIIDIVCNYYGKTPDQLKFKTRLTSMLDIRNQAIYFINKYTECSLSTIAKEFNRGDHSTIINALKSVDNLKDTNKKYALSLDELNELIIKDI